MPIYEYRCRQCDATFPRLQKPGAAADGVECPKCGSREVERLISTFSSSSSGEGTATAPAGPGCGGFT